MSWNESVSMPYIAPPHPFPTSIVPPVSAEAVFYHAPHSGSPASYYWTTPLSNLITLACQRPKPQQREESKLACLRRRGRHNAFRKKISGIIRCRVTQTARAFRHGELFEDYADNALPFSHKRQRSMSEHMDLLSIEFDQERPATVKVCTPRISWTLPAVPAILDPTWQWEYPKEYPEVEMTETVTQTSTSDNSHVEQLDDGLPDYVDAPAASSLPGYDNPISNLEDSVSQIPDPPLISNDWNGGDFHTFQDPNIPHLSYVGLHPDPQSSMLLDEGLWSSLDIAPVFPLQLGTPYSQPFDEILPLDLHQQWSVVPRRSYGREKSGHRHNPYSRSSRKSRRDLSESPLFFNRELPASPDEVLPTSIDLSATTPPNYFDLATFQGDDEDAITATLFQLQVEEEEEHHLPEGDDTDPDAGITVEEIDGGALELILEPGSPQVEHSEPGHQGSVMPALQVVVDDFLDGAETIEIPTSQDELSQGLEAADEEDTDDEESNSSTGPGTPVSDEEAVEFLESLWLDLKDQSSQPSAGDDGFSMASLLDVINSVIVI